jgi:hypothetical protein
MDSAVLFARTVETDEQSVAQLWTAVFSDLASRNMLRMLIEQKAGDAEELFFVTKMSGGVVGTALAGPRMTPYGSIEQRCSYSSEGGGGQWFTSRASL